MMESLDTHSLIIGTSLIIIASYGFNFIAKKTNIPSVLLLIVSGFVLSFFLPLESLDWKPILGIVGTVGLIMIVLEAALDLHLGKEQAKLMVKAFFIALILLLLTSAIIAMAINAFYDTNYYNSFAYAIPLSIMSSAIIIPSVVNLSEHRKEFMIYESAFSDILGIMFFYFILDSREISDGAQIASNIGINIGLTIVISIVLGYILIILIQKVTGEVKLFLPIAVLMLLYSTGKLFHLSSLVIVLAFGLMLNNKDFFFRGWFKQFFEEDKFQTLLSELKLLTFESSFLIRTFFFIFFGMSITLTGLDWKVFLVAGVAIAAIFGLRFIILSVMMRKDVYPAFYIAPRGLITVLLFFAIPEVMKISEFQSSVLLLVIIGSSLVMMYGLIKNKGVSLEEAIDTVDHAAGDVSEEESQGLLSPEAPEKIETLKTDIAQADAPDVEPTDS